MQRDINTYLVNLRDSDPAERIDACRFAARSSDKRFTEPLAGLLGDSCTEVRMMAAWAAGCRGDSSLVPELIRIAGRSDVSERTAAAHALGLIGDEAAIGSLKGLLSCEETLLQLTTAWALGHIGGMTAFKVLLASADTFPRDGTDVLASALTAVVSADAVTDWQSVLVREFRSASPPKRAVVAQIMVETHDNAYFEPLFQALSDTYAKRKGATSDDGVLLEVRYSCMLHDALREMRFARSDFPRLLSAYRQVRPDDRAIQRTLSIALEKCPAEIDEILELVRGQDLLLREIGLQVLATSHQQDGARILEEFLSSPEVETRKCAVRAICDHRAEVFLPLLLSALDDPDLAVRMAAVWGIVGQDDEDPISQDPEAFVALVIMVKDLDQEVPLLDAPLISAGRKMRCGMSAKEMIDLYIGSSERGRAYLQKLFSDPLAARPAESFGYLADCFRNESRKVVVPLLRRVLDGCDAKGLTALSELLQNTDVPIGARMSAAREILHGPLQFDPILVLDEETNAAQISLLRSVADVLLANLSTFSPSDQANLLEALAELDLDRANVTCTSPLDQVDNCSSCQGLLDSLSPGISCEESRESNCSLGPQMECSDLSPEQRHLLNCPLCRVWGLTCVPCEIVRNDAKRISRRNSHEYKRFDTLPIVEHCHLSLCPECSEAVAELKNVAFLTVEEFRDADQDLSQ